MYLTAVAIHVSDKYYLFRPARDGLSFIGRACASIMKKASRGGKVSVVGKSLGFQPPAGVFGVRPHSRGGI